MDKDHNLRLIKDCIRGKPEAQTQLYQRYKTYWFTCCLRYASDRMQAEDMLQDGVIAVFRKLEQFDSNKSRFTTWSYRIMINAALQYLRKWKKHDLLIQYQERYEDKMHEPIVYGHLGAKELTRLIQKLPLGYRTVFNLYVLDGYKHQEISKLLGISESTSKTQLFKARAMLRKQIEITLQSQAL